MVIFTSKQAMAILKHWLKLSPVLLSCTRHNGRSAEIILILKPGKSNELTSYLPTSLLTTTSKVPLKKATPNG
jgi:hypothetical protein